jgi:hypothetical protein
MATAPPEMVRSPVKLFAPVSVCVPDPTFVKASAAVPSRITPLKVVELFSVPLVSVAALAALLVMVPAPASDPMLFEKPPRSSVPPLAAVTDELLPNADVDPARNVPPLTAVVPV